MPQTCTICRHPEVREINKALVLRRSLRDIAGQYGVNWRAVWRHKNTCLVELLDRAVGDRTETFKRDLERKLRSLDKLIHAAEDWLQDPDNPEEFTLDPRASDVSVVYLEQRGEKVVKERGSLQVLLDRISDAGLKHTYVVIKRKDPVDSFIQAAREYRAYCESVLRMLEGGITGRVEVVLRALPMMKPKGAGE